MERNALNTSAHSKSCLKWVIAAGRAETLEYLERSGVLAHPLKDALLAPFQQKGFLPMPEMIRSVVSRVRVYFKDRRQSPRVRTRVLFSISIRRKARSNGAPATDRMLKGHTRDISITGLAMLLPQVHLEGHHLAAESRELQVMLELPGGAMPLVVIPKRYEKLDEAELGCNYLIGAKIVQVSDEDRIRLENFIRRGVHESSSVSDLDIS